MAMKHSLVFITGLLVLLTACVAPAGPAPAPAQVPATEAPAIEATAAEAPAPAEEPIRIGASLPLTGIFSVEGQKHRDGYELCVRLINQRGGLLGRQVELVSSDNRSDTEVAVAQYERLINRDEVDLLTGTFSSLLTFPTSAVAEQANMVYPIPSGGALPIWERGFESIFYFQQTAVEYIGRTPVQTLVDYRDRGVISSEGFPKTAAVVYADDFFPNSIVAGLLGQTVPIRGTDREIDLSPGFLEEAGIEVVFQQQFPLGFTDWIGLANSIKASDADLVFGLSTAVSESIELIRAMQTVDYDPQGMFVSQGTQSEFAEALGDAANGVLAFSSWHPAAEWKGLLGGESFTNQDFIQAFRDEFGRDPDEDEAIPFAVCQGLEQAVLATGTTDNEKLREWLASRTEDDPVRTILGDFHWDERGLPIGRYFLSVQWQDGELAFVYPIGEFPGVVDMVWPKPSW